MNFHKLPEQTSTYSCALSIALHDIQHQSHHNAQDELAQTTEESFRKKTGKSSKGKDIPYSRYK